jgi:hypothetical protein
MPNNFGGDQTDPDYAPHMYNDKGEFIGRSNEGDGRRVPRDPPAAIDIVIPPGASLADRRIRSVVGDYRAVIPDGAQKGRRFFTNNSPVVIERRCKDATGAEKWDRVTSFPKPGPKSSNEDADHAIYWLLAGPDAE